MEKLLALSSMLAVVVSTLTGSLAYADSAAVETQIQNFMGTIAFANAFHVGDSITTLDKSCQLSCDAMSCWQMCYSPAVHHGSVTSCDGKTEVTTWDDGSQPSSIDASAFAMVQGDLVLPTIHQLPQILGLQGSVDLKSAQPVSYALTNRSLSALLITGDVVTSQGQRAPFKMTVARDVPAIAQLLSFEVMGDMWTKVTELKP